MTLNEYFKYDVSNIKNALSGMQEADKKLHSLYKRAKQFNDFLEEQIKTPKEIQYQTLVKTNKKFIRSLKKINSVMKSRRDDFQHLSIAFSIQSNKKFNKDIAETFEKYAKIEPVVLLLLKDTYELLKNINKKIKTLPGMFVTRASSGSTIAAGGCDSKKLKNIVKNKLKEKGINTQNTENSKR